VLVGVAVTALLVTAASAAPVFVNVTAPVDGSSVAGTFNVQAETDASAGTATLLIDDTEVATTSVFGGGVPTYTVSFAVDSWALSNSDHSVRVAVDSSGATTSAPVTVTVENPDITSLASSLGTISPDKDRISDSTRITYNLASDANVTVVVKNNLAATVETLTANEATTAGAKAFIWKGYKNSRPDLKNGTYSIQVTATHLGASDTEMVAVKILCGKSKPVVTPMFTSFSPLDRDGVRDTDKIYVNVPKYSYLMVCVYSSSGRLIKVLSPYTLRSPGRYQWTWNGRSRTGALVPAGMYVIKAWTINQAGGWYSLGRVRVKGIRSLLLVRNLLRLWWLEGKDPLPGPTWADWRYNGERVAVFPLAMGMPGWSTPLGHTYVEAKRVWPTWYPPSWAGMSGPVGPGRSNPLGPRAMNLAPGGYDTGIRIHGTNNPSSIGTYASHGCIRMYPKDVIWLFDRVPLGTKVWVSRTLPSGYPLVGPNRPSWGVTRRWY
jgi:flagellar hook assembly protein FlgD